MENFDDAAKRHFQDAKLLHSQVPPRLANASHLYGFAAECSLKCVFERKGKVPRGSTGHFPGLLAEVECHSLAKGNAALLKRIKQCAAGLGGWTVGQRYYAQGWFTIAGVDAEAEAARKLAVLNTHHQRGIV